MDSNSDPTAIDYPIPGNDDARRSINLYCELLKETIIDAKKYIAKENIQEKKEKTLKPNDKEKKLNQEDKNKKAPIKK